MKHHDVDGWPVSLDTLCRKEPAWAANRLRALRSLLRDALSEAQSLNVLLCANIDAPYFDLDLLARIEKEVGG